MQTYYIHETPKVKKIEYIPSENSTLKKFEDTLRPHFSMNSYEHKKKTLILEEVDTLPLDRQAQYNTLLNKMEFLSGKFDLTSSHELLHMATTLKKNQVVYSGFSQVDIKNNTNIGIALNEGYTSKMDLKYFNNPEKEELYKKVYNVERYMCNMIEGIIGEEEMEEMYMNADLYTLVDKLSFYTSKEDVINFLLALDDFHLAVDNPYLMNLFEAKRAYRYCLMFISVSYIYGMYDNYYEKKISKNEYLSGLKFIKSFLKGGLWVGKPGLFSLKGYKEKEVEEVIKDTQMRVLNKKNISNN